MTKRHDRKTALREAIAWAVALVSLLAAVLIMQQRPAGHDELKISIETLRSQAVEFVALCLKPAAACLRTAPA